ncbi:MAG TPA: TIGR03016 family PEP-CTERM system-associated outer membrane protein [Caulobacter sp.]|nr:TIGR03016 family PEP-CTERM system-associated outer membrane protein [Caulobacter sp.]
MGRGFSSKVRRGRKDRALGASVVAAASASMLACGALVSPDTVEAQAQRLQAVIATPSKVRTNIRPYVRLEESFTDNAALSAGSRRSDFITRALAGLSAQVNHGRLTAALRAEYAYDRYARNRDLSGGTTYANGSGSYNVLRDRLWIDADGTVAQMYASSFPISGADRAGTQGRTRLAIYRVGPRLTARLGQFADLIAAIRSQWVSYGAEDSGPITQLPPDTNILQALGRIDTGDRFGGYQLLTSASVVRDDHDYHAASAVQSAYLRVSPKLRLVGRAGYEQVRERGVIALDAPMLSAGVEFRPNAASRVTLEGGRRYDRMAWNAKADVRVGKAVMITGEYYETLSPNQVYVASSFEKFVEQTRDLPAPVAPQNFMLRENIYNQTSYNKAAELHAIYSGERQSLDLSARWSRRKFIGPETKDETLYGSALYTRRIRPDVEVGLDANYSRTFDSPVYGEFEAYGVSGRVLYRLNSSTDFNASYHHTRGSQLSGGRAQTRENLFRVSLEKRF